MSRQSSLVACAAIVVVSGCCTIKQPKVSDMREQKLVADMAAKLQNLPIDASLKADFESKSQIVYAQLSDANVEFFLLLQALDCLVCRSSHEWFVSEAQRSLVADTVKELMITVRAKWAASHGLKGAPGGSFTPAELVILEKADSLGAAIQDTWQSLARRTPHR